MIFKMKLRTQKRVKLERKSKLKRLKIKQTRKSRMWVDTLLCPHRYRRGDSQLSQAHCTMCASQCIVCLLVCLVLSKKNHTAYFSALYRPEFLKHISPVHDSTTRLSSWTMNDESAAWRLKMASDLSPTCIRQFYYRYRSVSFYKYSLRVITETASVCFQHIFCPSWHR